VRGAHGDAGLPGLPGELVLSDSFLGIWWFLVQLHSQQMDFLTESSLCSAFLES
jgi:hypothetical protein